MRTHRFLLPVTFSLLALPAFAQDVSNREVIERINKMDRDMMTIQKQLARGENVGSVAPLIETGDASDSPADAPLVVRLSRMEDDLRTLRGKTEENEFQVRKLNETINKLQQDMDFRFNELKSSSAAHDAPASSKAVKPATDAAEKPEATDVKTEEKPEKSADGAVVVDPPSNNTTAGDGTLRLPEKKSEGESFDNPRDHYNHAFRLLNQTRYEDASKEFKDFTSQYPKDPLVGNAYYWLGETHYIRQDYVEAADNFRAGFEALPSGPKAADNLLKLSMSLAAMKKPKDACVVLDQLLVKFKETSSTVAQKAQSERTRIGCK